MAALINEFTVNKILDAFDDCAPSRKSRDMIRESLAEAESLDNQPPRVLVRMVAEAIVDGLRYDNWPGEPHYPTGWRS